jgi:hypothetical protein
MFKLASFRSALALGFVAAAMAGCNSNSAVSVSVTSTIQAALNVGCPILATLQASGLSLNSTQKAAATVLALACPPNPAPTSAVVAVADLISAYTILQPLVRH